jgi:hypothetical protein
VCEGAAGWYCIYRLHNQDEKRKDGPMKHYLKTDPEPFRATWSGQKTFEVRLDDRGYRVGDELILIETVHTGAEMKAGQPLIGTGRVATTTVRYILRGPIYGLADKWVIMAHDVAKTSRAQASPEIPVDREYKGEF